MRSNIDAILTALADYRLLSTIPKAMRRYDKATVLSFLRFLAKSLYRFIYSYILLI